MRRYLLGSVGVEGCERCHAQRPVDAVQDGLSLVDRLDTREKLRRCGELGIAGTVFEPLAGGVLTGRTAEQILSVWVGGPWEDTPWFRRILSPGKIEKSMAVADGVRAVAERLGVTVAQVAIAWVLHQPGVTSAIAGSASVNHTLENAGAGDILLTDALHELEALIPLGPTFT